MRNAPALVLFIVSIFSFVGCAGAKMSVIQPSELARPVKRIAIAPGAGPFGEAIGLELFNRGLNVVGSNEARAIVARVGLTEFEIMTTEGFSALNEKGIDAVLVAKTVDALDGTPESASVRIADTVTGEIIAGITWQNGYGGMRGSPADRMMRKNLSEAANQIADELASRIQPKGTAD